MHDDILNFPFRDLGENAMVFFALDYPKCMSLYLRVNVFIMVHFPPHLVRSTHAGAYCIYLGMNQGCVFYIFCKMNEFHFDNIY